MRPADAGPPAATQIDTDRLHGHALFLGDRIDLRSWHTTSAVEHHPLVLPLGVTGRGVLFRFGVVVLFDTDPGEEHRFLEAIAPHVINPFPTPEREDVELEIGAADRESVDLSGVVHLQDASPERLSVVAESLAKSVVLAHCEAQVTRVIESIEPTTRRLRETGRNRARTRALVQQIADVLLVELRTVGRAEVIDKPEILWERPDLERLHQHLEDEFELRERQRILDRKLGIIARASETYLDLIQTRTGLRVEWSIMLLIVFEILLTLYAMFGPGHP